MGGKMIDYESIDPNKTVWEIISDTLISRGFEVYPPATKVGECKREYIVLKQDGSSQKDRLSTQTVYYAFMLYVPKNQYSRLGDFEKRVKEILDTDLFPLIMPAGSTDTDYYDDNYNAHMRTFLYRNYVRNKHL